MQGPHLLGFTTGWDFTMDDGDHDGVDPCSCESDASRVARMRMSHSGCDIGD